MCVIIVKPAGVKMPTNEIITAAYHTNPHGCGIVSPTQFYKGTSYRQFKKTLNRVSIDEPCIIHFRLATHGSIKKANCHPFVRGDVFFAHNGILSIKPIGDMTDSETAFQEIIYPAIEKYGYASKGMDVAVAKVIGYSKFAFLKGDDVQLYGDFIRHSDGCLYSNLRFLPFVGWQRNYRGQRKVVDYI
ncbi:MAG: class II glutamine amidotransferase [Roseburia sp.]|nr:class II glutamine amidotransferase [Roseburia sp.]